MRVRGENGIWEKRNENKRGKERKRESEGEMKEGREEKKVKETVHGKVNVIETREVMVEREKVE
jgi:hypothetical protein